MTKVQITAASSILFASGLLLASVTAQKDLKRILNSPELADSLQYEYSQAPITAANTQLVHIAGQVGVSENDQNDFESQIDHAFRPCI